MYDSIEVDERLNTAVGSLMDIIGDRHYYKRQDPMPEHDGVLGEFEGLNTVRRILGQNGSNSIQGPYAVIERLFGFGVKDTNWYLVADGVQWAEAVCVAQVAAAPFTGDGETRVSARERS